MKTKTRVVLIVIGAFGADSLLTGYLSLTGVMTRKIDSSQQTAVLKSARILKTSVYSSLVVLGR